MLNRGRVFSRHRSRSNGSSPTILSRSLRLCEHNHYRGSTGRSVMGWTPIQTRPNARTTSTGSRNHPSRSIRSTRIHTSHSRQEPTYHVDRTGVSICSLCPTRSRWPSHHLPTTRPEGPSYGVACSRIANTNRKGHSQRDVNRKYTKLPSDRGVADDVTTRSSVLDSFSVFSTPISRGRSFRSLEIPETREPGRLSEEVAHCRLRSARSLP